MFVANTYPSANVQLFAALSKVTVPLLIAALLTILFPVALFAALVDFIWFRFRAPQPQKGLWEF